jgi:hypothetical protein
VISIVTFYGLDGLEFATHSDRTIKTTSEAHPASASIGTGVHSWAKLAAVRLTIHLHLVPRLRMSGATPLFPICTFAAHLYLCRIRKQDTPRF